MAAADFEEQLALYNILSGSLSVTMGQRIRNGVKVKVRDTLATSWSHCVLMIKGRALYALVSVAWFSRITEHRNIVFPYACLRENKRQQQARAIQTVKTAVRWDKMTNVAFPLN